MRARGFTIIEMLVVIGILALLMGLTIGGIAAMRKTDKLLATEHLVSGLVRQARHTARTSGSPVILQITKSERRISGVTRVSLAQEGFEGAASSRLDPTRSLTNPPPHGITGHGAEVESLPTGGDTAPEMRLELPDKLIRQANHNEGFYLSCSVRPPLIAAGGSQPSPILVVGNGDQIESAIGGIYLRRLQLAEQNVTQTGQTPRQPLLVTWEIVGVVYNSSDPATPYEVSSLDPQHCPAGIVRDEPPLHLSAPDLALNAISRRSAPPAREDETCRVPPKTSGMLAYEKDFAPVVGADGGFKEQE